MKLEVGLSYATKCGNKVICQSPAPDEKFWCVYEKTIEGHESLEGKQQLWEEDGSWSNYPGGIHDIVKELP